LKYNLPARPLRGMARQTQKKVPEHIKFFIANRTFSTHGWYFTPEFDVAWSACIHVEIFTWPFIGIHATDMLYGLFASTAINV